MKTWILLTGILVAVYLGYRAYRIVTLNKGLDRLLEKGAVILDVRTAQEFETGHIEGALNISLGTIRERYKELDTAKTYITCCSHGLRSVKVKSILEEKGFRHVYNGGAWTDLEEIVKKLHAGK